jgi:hypothetical protein
MKTFAAFLIGFFGAVATSFLSSMLLFPLIYGHRQGDSSGNWSLYPVFILFFWAVSILIAFPIGFAIFGNRFDRPSRAMLAAISSGLFATLVALIVQAFNPDLRFYSR